MNTTTKETKTETEALDPDQVEATPVSEAENYLIHISNAEKDCRVAESEVQGIKEDLKSAKQRYEDKVNRLLQLCREAEEGELPLFDQKGDQQELTESEVNEDAWKEQPTSVLWAEEISGFGEKKREAVIDMVPTLGKFEDLRAKVGSEADHLSKLLPKGCGEKLADELEERLIVFITSYSEPVDGGNDLRDEGLKFMINEITSEDDWLDGVDRDNEDFTEGWQDYLNGDDLADLETEVMEQLEGDSLKNWCHGWAAARAEHEAEKETSKEAKEPVL